VITLWNPKLYDTTEFGLSDLFVISEYVMAMMTEWCLYALLMYVTSRNNLKEDWESTIMTTGFQMTLEFQNPHFKLLVSCSSLDNFTVQSPTYRHGLYQFSARLSAELEYKKILNLLGQIKSQYFTFHTW
jgi:negative regulator of sigma E activity